MSKGITPIKQQQGYHTSLDDWRSDKQIPSIGNCPATGRCITLGPVYLAMLAQQQQVL